MVIVLSSLLMISSVANSPHVSVNTIKNVSGNSTYHGGHLNFTITTEQTTVNPNATDNVSYTTHVTVTSGTNSTWNMSSFDFYPPDNASTNGTSDYVVNNVTTGAGIASTYYKVGNYSYVHFELVDALFNESNNNTMFNITWIMYQPIAIVKTGSSRAGRVYTETWNITSAASDMTIQNASLFVTPAYWYTKVGTPSTITFNSTAKNYKYNLTMFEVWTNLTVRGVGTNLIDSGSGYETLSIVYNGPTIDASSGSSPSKVVSFIPEITPENVRTVLFVILGSILAIGTITTLVIVLKRR